MNETGKRTSTCNVLLGENQGTASTCACFSCHRTDMPIFVTHKGRLYRFVRESLRFCRSARFETFSECKSLYFFVDRASVIHSRRTGFETVINSRVDIFHLKFSGITR